MDYKRADRIYSAKVLDRSRSIWIFRLSTDSTCSTLAGWTVTHYAGPSWEAGWHADGVGFMSECTESHSERRLLQTQCRRNRQ
jgi:hypothetical protein